METGTISDASARAEMTLIAHSQAEMTSDSSHTSSIDHFSDLDLV